MQTGRPASDAFARTNQPPEDTTLQAVSEIIASRRPKRLTPGPISAPCRIVGSSPAINTVKRRIERLGPSDASVVIDGETGTGKTLVARCIHEASPRAAEPFVTLNCASIAPGLEESELFGHVCGAFTGAMRSYRGAFRSAGEGTLFLDEIGELPLGVQAKLLRALEERRVRPIGGEEEPFEARVICATNRDLAELVREGRFRADLYYRIAVVSLRMPPLRHRPSDVPELTDAFLAGASRQLRFSAEARARLTAYAFPGNVRELRNILERLIIDAPDDLVDEATLIQTGRLESGHLSVIEEFARAVLDVEVEGPKLERMRDALFSAALECTGGNVCAAARLVGEHRMTLVRWMTVHR